MLPPRWLRRLLLAPAVVVAALTMIGSFPVWLILTAFASRFIPGRWRPLRLTWFLLVWLAFESIAIIALFVLWVASGFGWRLQSDWFVEAHYKLMGWFLGAVVRGAMRTFGLSFETEWEGDPDVTGQPLVVLSRHAGPGDSLMLAHAVCNRLDRRPRVVLKDILQWDPAIDVLLNRLPNRFIATGRRAGPGAIEAIGHLAQTMGPEDALIIFPEGANFTPGRRLRAIDQLEAKGLDRFADRARGLEYLLPPKPGGVIAAVTNAPDAAVGLVGHVGMDHMISVGDIWKGLEMDRVVYTRIWLAEASHLPSDRAGLEEWLYDHWDEMDEWIAAHREAGD